MRIAQFRIKIKILPAGQLIEKDTPALKGRCNTHYEIKNGHTGELKHTIQFLWGLNPDVFKKVAAHELSHAVIAEAVVRTLGKRRTVPYEEGRCKFTSYTFARSRGLPDYIIEGYAENQVDNYREEFLYVRSHPPESIKALLTSIAF